MSAFEPIIARRLIAGLLMWGVAAVAVATADENSPPSAAYPSAVEQAICNEPWHTEFRERRYRVAHPVWETTEQETRTKVLRPVWETQWRDETYIVRKPVVETAMRQEQYTMYEPVTTYVPQTVDQGQWVEQQTIRPRPPATRLRWIPGGWTVDPKTGSNYWKPPMLRPVQVERPPRVTARRVWQPDVTVTQVPTTAWEPRVHTRKVPVQQVRYVEERRVRKVPQRVCRMVEQEIVQRTPVTVCRTVYEERVESVPVQVRGCAPVSAPSEGGLPMPAPSPSPLPPTSRPEIDPSLPVPAPVLPEESLRPEGKTSSEAPRPLVPVTFASYPRQS
ncbi:MAG TPA: hypothetical protein VHC19_17580 [Pirellulales bacterium]|nr:hypothetical protein [Pirellulales bacterium]